MSELKNYNESVIIPFLQRKVQEITNQNLVLEVNILVERQKKAEIETELSNVKKELEELKTQLIESGFAEEVKEETPEPTKKKKKIKLETEVLDASTY